MLTRLRVSGFKNLIDVDVRFGAFTCIAGANAMGKSNLFDAICFLSALASGSLIEAAQSVRSKDQRVGDLRALFYRQGLHQEDNISFDVEMITPKNVVDDFGQRAEASDTFLKYKLTLGYRHQETNDLGELEILEEELSAILLKDAKQTLGFEHSDEWFKSAIQRTGSSARALIETVTEDAKRMITLRPRGRAGHPLKRLAASMPRTILSATNATDNPTVVAARREMQSWRMLQLEPSALRQPDQARAPSQISMHGEHLPATLYRLAHQSDQDSAQVYQTITNALGELIQDIHGVCVDRDEQRDLLTVNVENREGTKFSARDLSDGTLRFLALATLLHDPKTQGVICLEEPEDGIHPMRIAAMLSLLENIAVDTKEPLGPDNPMRQVIVSTHSPLVVASVPADSLLGARIETNFGKRKGVQFRPLPETWRVDSETPKHQILTKNTLLDYLGKSKKSGTTNGRKLVQDYLLDYPLLPFIGEEEA